MRLVRFLLPLTALTAALAQPPAGPGLAAFDDVKAYLGLSDSTLQSIQQSLQSSRATIQALEQQLAAKHKSVADLLATGTSDAAAVGKLVLEEEALRKQIKTQADALVSKSQSYLTTDQKTRLKGLEDAAKLRGAIQGAVMLRLMTAPEPVAPGPMGGPGMGMGRPGGMMRGPGPMMRD